LPAEIVKSLGIKAGDKLVMELIDGRIVALPKPENWVEYIATGLLKGTYGATPEVVDSYIRSLREGPERWEWRRKFEDHLRSDPEVLELARTLQACPFHQASVDELASRLPLDSTLQRKLRSDLREMLETMLQYGGVRKVRDDHGKEKYYLVDELAQLAVLQT